jgi:hypothetical protein
MSPAYGPYVGFDPGPAAESIRREALPTLKKKAQVMPAGFKSHKLAIAAAAKAMAQYRTVEKSAAFPIPGSK